MGEVVRLFDTLQISEMDSCASLDPKAEVWYAQLKNNNLEGVNNCMEIVATLFPSIH